MRLKHFINRIVKGLVTDIAKSMFPNDAAYKIENAVLVNKDGDDFIITTKRGNRLNFSLPDGLVPIGFKVYDDILYIVSYEEVDGEKRYEIGSYPSPRKLVKESNPDNTGSLIHDFVQCYSLDDSLEGYEDEYKPIPMAKGTYDGNEYLFGFTTTEIAFNKNYIDILPRKSYDGSVDLFICDGENYNRTINTGFTASKILKDRLPEYDNTFIEHEKINRQFLSVNKPVHSNFEVEQGGKLRYGRLFFYIRYLDISFNPTNWYPMEGPVQISYGSKYYDIHGGDPENDIPTDKQVKFTLSNLDTAFRYFEVGVFYERGQASTTPPVKKAYLIHNRYEIDGDERELLITGREEEAVLTPEELIMPATKETISLSHTHHNKRYFGARWKRKKFYPKCPDWMSASDLYVEKGFYHETINSWLKEFAKRCYITPTMDTEHDEYVENNTPGNAGDPFLYYQNNLIRHQNYEFPATYKPGDVVMFGMVGLLDDGTFTEPTPITGFNNFKGYNSDGSKYDIEYYVNSLGIGMDAYLTDNNNTNHGLFQFPMPHKIWGSELDPDDKDWYGKAERSMGIKLHLDKANDISNDNYFEICPGIKESLKAIYLVRYIPDENFLYSGLSLTGACRVYIGLDRDGGDEGDPFWKYYIYFNKLKASTYYRDKHSSYPDHNSPLIYEGSSFTSNSFGGYIDNDFVKALKSDVNYFPITHKESIGYLKASDEDTISPVVDFTQLWSSPLFDQKGFYGLYSDDLIYNRDRTVSEINNVYYVSMGKNFSADDPGNKLPPVGKHNHGSPNILNFYLTNVTSYRSRNAKPIVTEKDVNNGFFFSAMGDQLFSVDLRASIYDPAVADEFLDEYLFGWIDLNEFCVPPPESIRSMEVRTSPYIGLRLHGMGGNEDLDVSYDATGNSLVTIYKRDPKFLYSKVLNEIKDKEFLPYQICSKDIDIFKRKYNGNDNSYFENEGTHIAVFNGDIDLFNGQSFLTKSYIKTKYTEVFKNYPLGDNVKTDDDGTVSVRDTKAEINRIYSYVKKSNETVSFCGYTKNNIHMQGFRDKYFYPYEQISYDDKIGFSRGLKLSEKYIGFNDILDASYNRTTFPNEFLRYPDYYKDDFEFNGRVRYSPQYRDGAYRDSWRNIPPIQFIDFDLAYGFISGILNVLGRLVLIHTGAIYQLFSDQREIKQSETGTELTLGIGGVLENNRKPLTEMFGSELPVFENGLAGAYGISLSKNKLWQITQIEGGGLSVTDLSLQYRIEDDVRETLSVLDSYELISDVFSNKIDIGYSESESCVYFSILKRENKKITAEKRADNIYRIYAEPEDYDIMGVETLFLNFGNGWDMYDVDLGVGYVDVHYDGYVLCNIDNMCRISMFATKGKTYVYDEIMKYFHTMRAVPDYWISGKDIRAIKRNPIDLNDGEVPEVGIFVSDEDASYGEFFGIVNEMRVGVIINGISSEEGLNSIQKMFVSSKVTSDEEDFIRALFSTEFQQSYLFPFLNEIRFWELPYYSENKWEFNIPVQITGSQGYDENAQMRGIWMKLELHYRGDSKKYIKDIITKVSPSYS